MYKTLDSIIGDKYVNIVALPFGSPYKKSHSNFEYILNGSYDGFDYKTVSTLRVGWESDYSPFSNDFDKTLIKRIRAYDNNGDDFDIEYNFNNLKNNRYISDGNKDLIVFPSDKLNKYNYFRIFKHSADNAISHPKFLKTALQKCVQIRIRVGCQPLHNQLFRYGVIIFLRFAMNKTPTRKTSNIAIKSRGNVPQFMGERIKSIPKIFSVKSRKIDAQQV